MRGPIRPILLLLMLAAVPLGGCAASLAASAVGAAVRGAQKPVDPNLDHGPAALAACRERAGQEGAVHIIDVERRSPGRVVVWGTVEQAGRRRSFECRFNGKIAGFTLREIAGR